MCWLVFRGTWGRTLEFEPDRIHFGPTAALSAREQQEARQQLDVQGWGRADGLAQFVRAVHHAVDEEAGSSAPPLARLASLSADIDEMKPLLVRGYRPEKSIREYGTGFLAFLWLNGHRHGVICFARNRRELREQLHVGAPRCAASNTMDSLRTPSFHS